MNCIIPSANIKILSRALHTLAKIGDELYIEARQDHVIFATINQNKTSFVTCKFENVFFSLYETSNSISSDENSNALTCKLHMKALLNIFKLKGPRDKKVDLCKIELNNDPNCIILKLKYKQDITIVHSIRLIDMEFISVSYDKSTMPNEVSGGGYFFSQVLTNFQISDEDMNLDVKHNKITIRNYDVASSNVSKCIRSQVVLNSNEFILYKIGQESNVTMRFKPLRAAVGFAEMFNLNIIMNFDKGGKPVILTIKNPTFEFTFVLSTINPDGSTQSCSNTTFSLPNKKANKAEGTELSKEDRTMLETLNWDSDFEVDGNEEIDRNNEGPTEPMEEDVIPKSPESPRTKRLKLVFGRCFEPTCHESRLDLGEELAPNSDSE